jgi:cytochrome c oxidase subunit 4
MATHPPHIKRVYVAVFLLLLVLTGLTVWVAYYDLGILSTWIAMTIAVTKGLLVVLYFMHVRYSSRLTWVVAGAGFLWLIILIALTLSDYRTRLPVSLGGV